MTLASSPIFNADQARKDVEAQVTIASGFGQQASRAIGDYASTQQRKAAALREQAVTEADPDKRTQLQQQAQQLEAQWGDQGSLRLLAHATVGVLTGDAAGAAGAAAGTLSAPAVSEALRNVGIDGELNKTLTALASSASGAAAGSAVGAASGAAPGAAAALNEATNNFLTHAESSRRLRLQTEQLACTTDACRQDKQAEINQLNRLDAWRDQQIEQACKSPASAECQSWTAAIQTAAQSYQGQSGNHVDTAERSSVLNQAYRYRQATHNPFLNGVGTGLLKLTPPGLAVGAVGGVAAMVGHIQEKGLGNAMGDALAAMADIPQNLRDRLNSPDPTVRGEALVDVIALASGVGVATAGGARFAINQVEQLRIRSALVAAEERATAKMKVETGTRSDDGQQYDQFRKPESTRPGGEWDWQKQAPNNGAVPGTQQAISVKAGDLLDRYGSRQGEYFSPAGTPVEARALPPGKSADPYEKYTVQKPFTVVQETVAPAFGQPGGGIQRRAQIPEVQGGFATMEDLVRNGYLKEVNK